ncbi:MAG: hypothetical protein E7138_09670 [Rikenellaceae bacterium]|nr:hypothetical protein [Rikenellaceae bacterium]MBQ3535563.1 hypothetical protein [Alistipes sp.]MBQ8544995.1 hypothetical protein [Alistipes sp.]MBR3702060.1 hypothetical protein [Alistipes sp.]
MTNNQYWERLDMVIRWANMSANSFGKHIGLSRSESLYQIKAGRFGISHNLAKRITDRFPEISLGWLLSGEGKMLCESNPILTIPYYDQDIASCRAMDSELLRPSGTLTMPMIEQCDCAFRSFDSAINDDIMAGSIVFLKKTDTKAIIPGRFYVIVTANYVILRKLRFAESATFNNEFILEASNDKLDSVRLHENEVEKIYRVVASLKMY